MIQDAVFLLESKNFLAKNRTAVIVTFSANDTYPHAATIYYFYDSRESIFFATSKASEKTEALELNDHVALVITDEEEKQTMQIKGIARIVSDSDQRLAVLEEIYQKVKNNASKPMIWPLLKLHPDDVDVVEIKIDTFKYSHFGEKASIIEKSVSDLRLSNVA